MGLRAASLQRFFEANGPVVSVTVTEAKGSTPRETGAWMAVSESSFFGTIGGGQLEMMAINAARQLIETGNASDEMNVPLGPEIGQCCGGRVVLALDRLDEEAIGALSGQVQDEDRRQPQVYVFGAGHVGKALTQSLSPLPLRTILVETRQAELDATSAEVEKQLSAMPESLIAQAAPHSVFVVLTHDHALDFLIVQQALVRGDAAYVGMIGSKTKRAAFLSWHKDNGGDPAEAERLICPIGGRRVSDKRPEVIAALVAAEIITVLAERVAS
ncbi:MAG: xanthine dehydrogenase accessory protein XdhC [Pseudomonadota bacterium]